MKLFPLKMFEILSCFSSCSLPCCEGLVSRFLDICGVDGFRVFRCLLNGLGISLIQVPSNRGNVLEAMT